MTNALPLVLSAAGLTSSVLGFVTYLRRIESETVPKRPVGTLLFMLTGAVLAAMALRFGGGPLTYGLAGTAIFTSAFFVYLLRQAPLPDGELVLGVGDTLLPFEAVDSHGTAWSSEALAGKRVLLKFFRGGW